VKYPLDIEAGDTVRLKKKHPCGSNEWRVRRTGVDIRITCLGCQRSMLVPRAALERKIIKIIKNTER
jgi:hypothetical protein